MNKLILFFSLLLAAVPANAQPSVATMTMTANGQPSATIALGETINLRATLFWTNGPQTGGQAYLAGIHGGVVVTDNAGAPANFSSDFTPGGLVNFGSFVGGSRPEIEIVVTPPFFGGWPVPPSTWSAGIKIAAYDLALTTPGTYQVAWNPHPTAPFVRLYLTNTTVQFTDVPTTYLPATITVTPTPATLALLLAFAPICRRR